jgi:hypothetical protein
MFIEFIDYLLLNMTGGFLAFAGVMLGRTLELLVKNSSSKLLRFQQTLTIGIDEKKGIIRERRTLKAAL